jgi:hypothetical protein
MIILARRTRSSGRSVGFLTPCLGECERPFVRLDGVSAFDDDALPIGRVEVLVERIPLDLALAVETAIGLGVDLFSQIAPHSQRSPEGSSREEDSPDPESSKEQREEKADAQPKPCGAKPRGDRQRCQHDEPGDDRHDDSKRRAWGCESTGVTKAPVDPTSLESCQRGRYVSSKKGERHRPEKVEAAPTQMPRGGLTHCGP